MPKSGGNAGGPHAFKTLIQREYELIECERKRRGPVSIDVSDTKDEGSDEDRCDKLKQLEVSLPGAANEPWVDFTVQDYFGLALSGGGIRSATYNLGLLQGLDQQGVLGQVDYLSTVSGGGYIGGFWTAWRLHSKSKGDAFPRSSGQANDPRRPQLGNRDIRESPHIRHLREFSRFLMPRVGIAHAETWAGVVAILGGLIPSLCAALALLGAALYAWFGSVWLLAWLPFCNGWLAAVLFGAITFGLHSFMERGWRKMKKGGDEEGSVRNYRFFAASTGVLSGFAFWFWHAAWRAGPYPDSARALIEIWTSPINAARHATAAEQAARLHLEVAPFGISIAWARSAVALLLARAIALRAFRNREYVVKLSSVFDRSIARLLAPAVVCAALSLVWFLANRLHEVKGLSVTATSGVGLAALFAWLRNWLAKPVVHTQGSELMSQVLPRLKPLLPQLLANAAFACFLLGVAVLIQKFGLQTGKQVLLGTGGCIAALVFTLFAFDPARIGMHDFYRSRIARCFLGAARANEPGVARRATVEQLKDDMTFDDIGREAAPKLPIHLVCCAANNLAGDVLGSLYRGARSAIISPLGFSIGNTWAPPPRELRLSSALTASAAAFNSQMGSISMALGPAVAFLMSALNLRLGLWVRHPLCNSEHRSRWVPGWPFFLEMLGLTTCGPATTAADLGLLGASVHLSDGAHFENLGLYELIRRHCRYVIVSDCSADPDFAFGDLGNAVRRIREDFGVEIELDTSPLRPAANGRAVQHAVVGSIHYDGVTGTDKGMIIYFKPALTGDEPPDILQYQVRKSAFPHETTGDQFYDEAQWESYRRLGEHAVHAALRQINTSRPNFAFVDRLFLDASQRWHPRLERHKEVFLELTERYVSLESEIRRDAPASLRAEYFPEVTEALTKPSAKQSPAGPQQPGAHPHQPSSPSAEDETARTLYFLALVLQLMEDVWVGLELETYWSHPLNEGWMNYFQRWASTPSLRRWWPVLRPLFSGGFRDFVRDRFDLHLNEKARLEDSRGAQLRLIQVDSPNTNSVSTVNQLEGLALKQWLRRYPPPKLQGKRAFVYEIHLDESAEAHLSPIQVGFLLYSEVIPSHHQSVVVKWYAADLFVPQSLNGAGIVARFLDAVIAHFEPKTYVSELYVELDGEMDGGKIVGKPLAAAGRDPASRRDRVHLIGFYKSRGFTYLNANSPQILRLDLGVVRRAQKERTETQHSLPE